MRKFEIHKETQEETKKWDREEKTGTYIEEKKKGKKVKNVNCGW